MISVYHLYIDNVFERNQSFPSMLCSERLNIYVVILHRIKLLLSVIHSCVFFRQDSPYVWTCRNTTCEKIESSKLGADESGNALEVCKLNCGKSGTLWPLPTGKVCKKNQGATFCHHLIVSCIFDYN